MKSRHFRTWFLALGLVAASEPATARGPRVYALTEVRIFVEPGQEIAKGTVVFRDGIIEAIGADITPPADARVLERPEFTVYPGLIDAYVEAAWPLKSEGEARGGAHTNPLVRPERDVADHGIPPAAAEKLREAGFTTAAIVPKEGMFRGRSAVSNLGEGVNENLLRTGHAQNVAFARTEQGGGYPSSLMGSIALFRQTLLDTRWHAAAWAAYDADPAQERPEMNLAYAELAGILDGGHLVVFKAESALDTLRSASLAREFGLRAHLVGSGEEYRWLEQITAIGAPLIIPVNFPEVPDAPENDDLVLALDTLRHWDSAPRNPKALLDAGNTIALTSHGLDDPREVLKNLYIAIEHGGLGRDEALAALTTTPARLLGIEDRAGTLAAGKMANLVLTEGDLFAEKPSVREVWIDGRRFEIKESKPAAIEPAGTWQLTVTTEDGETLSATMILEGEPASLSGTISDPAGNRIAFSSAAASGTRLEIAFDGTAYGMSGDIEFFLDIQGDKGAGDGTSPNGAFTIKGSRSSGPKEQGW